MIQPKSILSIGLQSNESVAELRAEGSSAPAACSPAAGEEYAALTCALVPPAHRPGSLRGGPGNRHSYRDLLPMPFSFKVRFS